MRLLNWIFRFFLLLAILIVIALFMLFTTPGFRGTVYIAAKFIPGHLHYQDINGSLIDPIEIKKLSYTDQGEKIFIKDLDLKWKPFELIHHKLHITQLQIDGITIITPKSAPATPPSQEKPSLQQTITHFLKNLKAVKPEPLTLPLTIQIDHAQLTHIRIGPSPEQPSTVIKYIDINGSIIPKNIHLTVKAELTEPQRIIAKITARGNISRYTAEVLVNGTHYQLALHAIGNQDGVTISIPPTQLFHGSINGMLNLAWYPIIDWHIQLETRHLNLQSIDNKIPHPLTLHLKTKGQLIDGNPVFDMSIRARAGSASIHLNAHHHTQWHGSWVIAIANLQSVYPAANGDLQSKGTFHGALTTPNSRGFLTSTELVYDDIHLNNLKLQWGLSFQKLQQSSLLLHLNQLQMNSTKINQISLRLKGNLADKKITASLRVGKPAVTFTTQAHYDGTSWRGRITQLNSQFDPFGAWALRKPAEFEYSPQNAFIQPVCLYTQKNAYLCVQGQWQNGGPWTLSLDSKNFSFAGLEKKFMPAVQTTSKLSITAQATGNGSNIEHATAKISLSKGMLTNYVDNSVINIAVRPSTINLLINHKVGLLAQVLFHFAQKDSLNVRATIPQFTDYSMPFKDKQLKTNIHVQVHNFNFVSIFEHTVKVSRGLFDGHFTFNGTIGKPKLMGKATLWVPHFEYTTVKVHAFNIKAHLNVDGNYLTYGLVGYAFNKAPLYFSGDTTLSQPYALTHFYVHTKDAEAIKTGNVSVFVNSNLKFLLTHDQLDIDGGITVPRATLAPIDFSSVNLMPINGVTYSGLPKHIVPETSRRKILNLNLNLGKAVYLKAFGLVANLKGKLKMHINPKQGTMASGQVRIAKGSFKAYGQDLTIADGSSVNFNHAPILDPYINARAYKNVATTFESTGMQLANNMITVGLQIHGTISHMKFRLYSIPPGISQADILSYLILGVAADNQNAASLSMLFNAANGMLNPYASPHQVSNESGFKRWLSSTKIRMRNETILDIAGNPVDDQASFVISNALTNNLFMQYSAGLIIPENVFSIKYRINDHWLIQSQTGTGYNVGTGADVIYTIED